MRRSDLFFGIILSGLFWAMPAAAYVGPGPGLSMLGSLFTLLGGIVVAIFMVLAYPIRLLMKRWRKPKA